MATWSDNPALREYAKGHPPPECPPPRRRYVFRDGRVIQSREYRQWLDDMDQWETDAINQLMESVADKDTMAKLKDYALAHVYVKCQCGFSAWVEHTDRPTEPKCPRCGGNDERSGRQD